MFVSFVPSADGKHKDSVVRFEQRSLTWLLVASVVAIKTQIERDDEALHR